MEGERKQSRQSKQSIRISVRNLVEFLFRSGDIDHRGRLRTENAMLEGGRIHRLLQSRMKSDYQAKKLLESAKRAGTQWCADAVKQCQILDRRMKSERGMDAEGELKLLLMRLGTVRR